MNRVMPSWRPLGQCVRGAGRSLRMSCRDSTTDVVGFNPQDSGTVVSCLYPVLTATEQHSVLKTVADMQLYASEHGSREENEGD